MGSRNSLPNGLLSHRNKTATESTSHGTQQVSYIQGDTHRIGLHIFIKSGSSRRLQVKNYTVPELQVNL